MMGLAGCLWLSSCPSWRCNSVAMVSSTTTSRRIGPASFDPGGSRQGRQEQLWEDLLSNPSEWCDNRLDKRIPRGRFNQRPYPVLLCLKSGSGKPEWVDSHIDSLAPQLQKGLGGAEGFHSFGHEFRNLCKQGQLHKALDVLLRMDQARAVPSVDLYRFFLKVCTKHKALGQAKRMQACLKEHRLMSIEVLGEDLVSTLVKCGGMADALEVFYSLPHRNVYCWTAIISGYANAGKGHEALMMWRRMQEEGVQPNAYTFVGLLKACGSIADVEEGKRIHAQVSRLGCQSHLFVVTSLISMYGKCGSLEVAQSLFDGLSQRDVVTWNAMLAAYVDQGQAAKALQLYERMQEEGVSPDNRSFLSALQACGMLAVLEEATSMDGQFTKVLSLEKGEAIHADARRKGFDSDAFVGNTLIHMYGKCGSIRKAQDVFAVLSQRDVVTWTVMIAAFVEQGQPEKGLQLYEQMTKEGVSPSSRTFVSAIQACGMLADKEERIQVDGGYIKLKSLKQGEAIHSHARRKGYDTDVFVGSTLVSMYGKCGSIADAQNVFDGLSERNVVTWNAMLMAFLEQNQADKALQMYEKMQEEGMSPDDRTFVTMLQACAILAAKEEGAMSDEQLTKVQSFEMGKAIHIDVLKKGYHRDVYVGNTLITMYSKCGSIVDARIVFDGLTGRNVVTWTAMVTAYVEQEQPGKALELYEQMLKEGVNPDNWTLLSALQACSTLADNEENVIVDGKCVKLKTLKKVEAIHERARRTGHDLDIFVASILMRMYGKCGSIEEAKVVFDRLSQHDVVTWNAMLAAYVEQGQADTALQLYDEMREQGICPDDRTFVSILQACGMLADKGDAGMDGRSSTAMYLKKGEAFHAEAQKAGYTSDVFVGNTLISMYGKCRSIIGAQHVFDGLPHRDIVTWNAMLTAFVEQHEAEQALDLFERMQEEGMSPDNRTFVSTLQACGMLAEKEAFVMVGIRGIKVKSLEKGEVIHAKCRRKGYDKDVFVGSTLVSLYGKCGSLEEARTVFDGLSHRNVVTWNAMLTAYLEQKEPEKAVHLFEQMQTEGVDPDNWTFVSALQACGMLAERAGLDGRSVKLECLKMGEAIITDARRKGYGSDAFLGNTMISMYGKCGSIPDAKNVFNNMVQQTVVTWNAMLAAYVEHEEPEEVLHLYEQMLKEGVSPDNWTFVGALQACGMLADKEEDLVVDGHSSKVESLAKGRRIHADAQRAGYASDAFIGTALVSMYGKCGSLVEAQNVFDGLSHRDVVSWNAMLAACAEQGQADMAFQLYRQMQQEGISPNEITIVCMLQGCGRAGSFSILSQIHDAQLSTRSDLSPLLANTLISAYGRCARMVDVQNIFAALTQPDLVSWNALIAAHARQGDCAQSIECYEKMQLAGVAPDRVTFLSLLSACSHAGLVERGAGYFESMSRDHGITPDLEHYVSMVDILGRAGFFEQVKELLSSMPMQPDLAMWLCVLGACQKHGEVALGEQAFACAVHLHPEHAAAYELMSNIYADSGQLERAKELKKMRQGKGAWKKPGQSWIEEKQRIHTFLVGDSRHPDSMRLYDMLRHLSLNPALSFVIQRKSLQLR